MYSNFKTTICGTYFLLLSLNSFAGDFINPILDGRMSNQQYEIIKRGAVAQCKSTATNAASRTRQPVNCEDYKNAYGGWNPTAYLECQRAMESSGVDKEVLVAPGFDS